MASWPASQRAVRFAGDDEGTGVPAYAGAPEAKQDVAPPRTGSHTQAYAGFRASNSSLDLMKKGKHP